MTGPKTQRVLDKLVVPQHKGEAEVWQNSRWVSYLLSIWQQILKHGIAEQRHRTSPSKPQDMGTMVICRILDHDGSEHFRMDRWFRSIISWSYRPYVVIEVPQGRADK
jgi:hypothetical protein